MAPVLPWMRPLLALGFVLAGVAQAQEHHHEGALAASLGDWTVSAHGFANAVRDSQGGPRGAVEWFSNSMFMVDGAKPLGYGSLELRGMFSLDPLMGRRGYPLLFQTGETANGLAPLVDRQHPHDAFMELSATYRQPLGGGWGGSLSAGLPGAPALGPPSFMHRPSGERIPEAPITHHWLDSTHASFGVLTAGLSRGPWMLEASRFNGREPDQARWNIETGRLDSSSVRLSYAPSGALSMQVSYGFLHDIEEIQANLSIHRITASVSYGTTAWGRPWATTLAWGLNRQVDRHLRHTLPAWLFESTLEPRAGHAAFIRAERLNHDEFSIEATFAKVSVGWMVDVVPTGPVRWSVGALASSLRPPPELRFFYGDRPRAWMLFLQARL